jgi:hypothetical protein
MANHPLTVQDVRNQLVSRFRRRKVDWQNVQLPAGFRRTGSCDTLTACRLDWQGGVE